MYDAPNWSSPTPIIQVISSRGLSSIKFPHFKYSGALPSLLGWCFKTSSYYSSLHLACQGNMDLCIKVAHLKGERPPLPSSQSLFIPLHSPLCLSVFVSNRLPQSSTSLSGGCQCLLVNSISSSQAPPNTHAQMP